jgi:hypothetical protein
MPASSGLAANVPGASTLQAAHFTPLIVTLLSFCLTRWYGNLQELNAMTKQSITIFKILFLIIPTVNKIIFVNKSNFECKGISFFEIHHIIVIFANIYLGMPF